MVSPTAAAQVGDELGDFRPDGAFDEQDAEVGLGPAPPKDTLDDFYGDYESDDEPSSSSKASPITTKAPLSAVQSLEKNKVDKVKKGKKKEKKNREKKEKQVKKKEKNEASAPLTKEAIGMIRFSAMASEHIGEMRNPRVGELPSRTTAIPEQPMRYNPKPATDAAAAAVAYVPRMLRPVSGLLGLVANDDADEYETDTDADDDDEENGITLGEKIENMNSAKKSRVLNENETFLGLVASGLDVVLEPMGGLDRIKAALPPGLVRKSPAEPTYADICDGASKAGELGGAKGAEEAEKAVASAGGLRSRKVDEAKPKKMRKKKRPLPPNPTRPLDEMEVTSTPHLPE
jgi:hypothetical protein